MSLTAKFKTSEGSFLNFPLDGDLIHEHLLELLGNATKLLTESCPTKTLPA